MNFRVRVGDPPVLRLPGTTTSLVRVDLGVARFDLALELHVLDDAHRRRVDLEHSALRPIDD